MDRFGAVLRITSILLALTIPSWASGPIAGTPPHPGHPDFLRSTLQRLGEPPLGPSRAKGASLRLILLRTFEHPVVIRLTRAKGAAPANATVGVLSGQAGFELGTVLERRSFPVSSQAWDDLVSRARTLLVRQSKETPSNEIKVASDGTQWIFELQDGPEYWIFRLDQPAPDTNPRDREYEALVTAFLSLATTRSPNFR